MSRHPECSALPAGLPERIVSLTPSNTELLFALGAGDRVVGVSRYCDQPAAALELPQVSGFIDADLGAIAALRPDLVLTSSHLQKTIVEQLVERDITVLACNPTSLDGVFRNMLLIGRVVGAFDRAQALVGELQGRVNAVVAAGQALPYHPRVFLEEWGKPLIPAGWWLAEFVALAGGIYVPAHVDTWRQSRERVVTVAEVAAADPELIVVSWPGVQRDIPRKQALGRAEWQGVSAVRHGRVYSVEDRLLHRPGPNLIDGLEAISRLVAATAEACAGRDQADGR
jgi:iron complex transport system substrate-binding protein